MKIGYIADIDFFLKNNIQRVQQIAKSFEQLGHNVAYIQTPTYNTKNRKIIEVSPTFKVFSGNPGELESIIKNENFDALIISWPFNFKHIPENYNGVIIYEILDDHSLVKYRFNEEEWDRSHNYLMNRADIVCAVSKKLINQYKEDRPDIKLSSNAVALEDWIIEETTLKKEVDSFYSNIRNKYRAVVGYYGMHGWWLDCHAVEEAAKKLNDIAFVFIGHRWEEGEDTKKFGENINNIFILGPKDYYELKYHLNNFDVATIPFKLCEMTHCVNPVKLYEYMAMGKPVIASEMDDILKYDSIVFYNNNVKLEDAIQKVLSSDNNSVREQHLKIAKENTWLERTKSLLEYIDDVKKQLDIELKSDDLGEYFEFKNKPSTKLCLITLVDYNMTKKEYDYFGITDRFFRKYCRKYNINYIILRGNKQLEKFEYLMYEKFRVKKFLEVYDRIVFVDADVLIMENAKNIFDFVPEDSLGMFLESDVIGGGIAGMPVWINKYKQILKNRNLSFNYVLERDWDRKYWNAGTMVFSGIHKYIFEDDPNTRVYDYSCFSEQGWINYLISRDKIKMFNITSDFSGWFSSDEPTEQFVLDSWINCSFIHFVGTNKAKRIKEFLHYYYKNKINKSLPKKVILSRQKEEYEESDIKLVQDLEERLTSLNISKRSTTSLMSAIDLRNFLSGGDMACVVGCYSGELVKILSAKFNKVFCIHNTAENNYQRTKQLCKQITRDCKNIIHIYGISNEIVNSFPDDFFDFIYLNSNNEYRFVKEDICLWWQKLKKDGYIGGHKYFGLTHSDSVIKPILEYFGNVDVLFENGSWLVHKTNQFIPKVSIIVPCYNHSKYIKECIDSILSQTYKNFEIIFIDDCSTDNSYEVVSEYNDPRLVLLKHEKNRGPAAARNTGIRASRGAYILPVDSDNYISKNCVEEYVNMLDDNQDCVIYCNYERFGLEKGFSGNMHDEQYSLSRLMKGNLMDNCSMYRRVFWYDVGGYDESPNVKGYEDWDFWIMCGLKGYKAKRVCKTLFYYRVTETSLCKEADKIRPQIINYMHTKYKSNKFLNSQYNQIPNIDTIHSTVTRRFQRSSDSGGNPIVKRNLYVNSRTVKKI